MRLWTIHPRHLDAKGLVALWREGLLAQKVLQGGTRGYRHHPQLERFRDEPDPVAAVAAYLREVHRESVRRGYRFDASRITPSGPAGPMPASAGQLAYEWGHLLAKLERRSPEWHAAQAGSGRPAPHPLFRVTDGPVASWERPEPRVRTVDAAASAMGDATDLPSDDPDGPAARE